MQDVLEPPDRQSYADWVLLLSLAAFSVIVRGPKAPAGLPFMRTSLMQHRMVFLVFRIRHSVWVLALIWRIVDTPLLGFHVNILSQSFPSRVVV